MIYNTDTCDYVDKMDFKRQKTKDENPMKKSWDFTIHSDDIDAEIEWLKSLEVNVLVAALEVGEETQKEHIQGRIVFKRAYRRTQLKKLHGGAHWEITTCEADANYCRKRNSVKILDIDNRKKKGERTDIHDARDVLQKTGSMREVVESTTSFQAVRMCEVYLKYCEKLRPIDISKMEVHWRYGPSEVHKTRHIWDTNSINDVFTPTTYKWWDGYDGHPVVLIDEFRGDWCKFRELLHILDPYPYRVETKGGSRQIQAYKFYITSCYPPDRVYSSEELNRTDKLWQLIRRFTTITECFMGIMGPESTDVTKHFKDSYRP